MIFDLNRVVVEGANGYLSAEALARLVDRVRQYLKKRVLAAFKPVRTEYYRRTLAYPVGSFQHDYALITVVIIVFL